MRKKFRISFNRVGEPGSLLQTILYVQFSENGKESETLETERIKKEFHNYFSAKRYAFKRATELRITDEDIKRTNQWFIERANRGEDKIF